MQARRIVLVAKGSNKAAIVKKMLQGPVTTDVPASILQRHPNCEVLLDSEAAALLDQEDQEFKSSGGARVQEDQGFKSSGVQEVQGFKSSKVSEEQGPSYLAPFLSMVFLFLVIGFLTTVNSQLQGPLQSAFLDRVGNLRNTLATMITFSWFLAYPVCGGLGSRWIDRYGYKGTLLRGLGVMVAGLALYFLSSVYTVAYPQSALAVSDVSIPPGFFIFLLGSFVLGGAVTVLQVVINPYLMACHVNGTQPIQRLAIGGSANSVGTTIAPYFVSGIVFGGVALEQVQVSQLRLPFLTIALLILLVAAVLYRLSLPDLAGTRAADAPLERSVWSFRHLTLGVVAIFFYVGCEVCVGANINLYALGDLGLSTSTVTLMATLYWGLMLVGRLCGSSLRSVSPRAQLTFTTLMALLMLVLAVAFNQPWLLVAVGLFHSIMWGAIFTLATTGLGHYTSAASGVFMTGVVGGAILPLLQGAAADSLGAWRWSWLIVLFGELVMLSYALVGSRPKEKAE
jgi:FHS family L-fucose permease-like MFS transporter